MPTVQDGPLLKLALPKGRMQDNIFELLKNAGIRIHLGARGYRPVISLPGYQTKILKPQNIVEMLHVGSRDLGFAGADWVAELQAELVELVDTKLDPVRIVAAAAETMVEDGRLPKRALVVASEYQRLTQEWIKRTGLNATYVRSFGATEVFPPEDADCIVDNTATGSTLEANGLAIVDELMRSSTRLYANPRTLEDPAKRAEVDKLVMLLNSVLEARERAMLEFNVPSVNPDAIIDALPAMREPTLAKLHHDAGFAVKVAVPRKDLPTLIPKIKAAGGTDLVVSNIEQIVP
jgi:ATP phosphoribosyltransferase